MARSRRYEVGVGCLLLVALGVLAWMALQVGAFGNLGPKTRVTARLPDAAGLQVGAVVAVAGVPVGTLEGLDLDWDHAIAHLAIDPSADVRRDATVKVRARSVLGEKYVALQPHSADAPPIANGDELRVSGRTVEIDELVSLLGPLVEALEPEAIAESMGLLAEALEDDPERLKRLLDNADTLLANGAEASEDLPDLVAEGRTTLRSARGTLGEVDARAREAEAVVARADTVLTRVDEASEALPDLLVEIEGAVGDARRVLATAESSTADVEQILDNLAEIDKVELRRLLREEGVLIRLRPAKVVEPDGEWRPEGSAVRGSKARR